MELYFFQELYNKASSYTSFILRHYIIFLPFDVGEGNNNIRIIYPIMVQIQIVLMWFI